MGSSKNSDRLIDPMFPNAPNASPTQRNHSNRLAASSALLVRRVILDWMD